MTDHPGAAKEDLLMRKMDILGIREEDIEERFVLSGKKGGQHANKSATCVSVRHRPTGIIVKCRETRAQGLNRFLARRILVDKIECLIRGNEAAERKKTEKIRRQKRRRSRRAKAKMLRHKRLRAEIKSLRRTPQPEL